MTERVLAMNRHYTVYLIHHSHTDIGYTDRQEKIMQYHADFIRQAISYLDFLHSSPELYDKYGGFVWQCENFWQVKNFYNTAKSSEKAAFEKYVKSGEIGLSGNYLNMTDLVDAEVLSDALDEMEQFGSQIGHPITAGMFADVNGFAWGYADQLSRHGVRYFFSALHNHHGMHPLYRKQRPFYLETPSGGKILMWSGEHYHFGNEMFFAPEAGTSYSLHDEFSSDIINNRILNHDAAELEEEETEILKTRLVRYINHLEEDGYEYDLIPFMVSGSITDNSSPSMEIAGRVHRLNEIFDGQIEFHMATLEQFFAAVEQHCRDIPTYRGDYTDWWADGIGSTPAAVKVYRDAVRKYNLCRKVDPERKIGKEDWMWKANEDLMLFAEHTWGYSSSISEPWNTKVGELELKKIAYASNADTAVSRNLDRIMETKGGKSISHKMSQKYLLINPGNSRLVEPVRLYIEFWEYLDGLRYDESMPVVVTDSANGEVIPCQVRKIARAVEVEIIADMKPHEEKTVEIHLAERKWPSIDNFAVGGVDGQKDIIQNPECREDADVIDTDYFHIETSAKEGICDIIWRKDQTSLIRENAVTSAFNGVYEITAPVSGQCDTRKNMGRNRKSRATHRSFGQVIDREITEKGPLSITLAIRYRLTGTRIYNVYYKIYRHIPKISVTVRIHKISEWDPENLYVSIPFTAGPESTLYINKTGCLLRPGIDQLPGTCENFYLIQDALVWVGKEKNVSVTVKDAPLIALGSLEAKEVVLCDGRDTERNHAMVWSWPMNNFWETNFKADLGGFYEFRYTVDVDDTRMDLQPLVERLKASDEGILTEYA